MISILIAAAAIISQENDRSRHFPPIDATPLFPDEPPSPFPGWKRVGQKEGGSRPPGRYGGIYQDTRGARALIKRDANPVHDMSEYVAGWICQQLFAHPAYRTAVCHKSVSAAVCDGYTYSPTIELVQSVETSAGNADGAYIVSYFLPSYQDLYKPVFDADKRPMMVGTFHKAKLEEFFKSHPLQGLSELLAFSLWIGDYDMHLGNFGVMADTYLARIDFGWALADLGANIEPFSRVKHLPLIGPTNHFTEYPDSVIYSVGFALALRCIARQSLRQVQEWVRASIEHMIPFYPHPATWHKWISYIFPTDTKMKDVTSVEILSSYITEQLARQLVLRQQSLLDLSTMVDLWRYYGGNGSREDLALIFKHNPTFFDRMLFQNQSPVFIGTGELFSLDNKWKQINGHHADLLRMYQTWMNKEGGEKRGMVAPNKKGDCVMM